MKKVKSKATRGNLISLKDIIYLAGFIDGEGTIRLNKPNGTNKTSFVVQVGIGNTNKEVLEWINSLFPSTLYVGNETTAKWKKSYKWAIYANKAITLIRLIQPYLKVKKAQAELAVKFHKGKTNACRYKPLSDSEKKFRLSCFKEMKRLNKKGN